MRRLLLTVTACIAGCGDSASAPSDGGGPDGFQSAPHAELPVVIGHNHVVLPNVHLITVTYEDYALRNDVEAFGDAVVASQWYRNSVAEYGAEPGVHAAKVKLGHSPLSLSRNEINAQIQQLIAQGVAENVPAGNVLFAFYVPPTVVRTFGAATAPVDDAPAEDATLPVAHKARRAARARSTRLPPSSYHTVIEYNHVRYPIMVVLDDGTGLAATTFTAGRLLVNTATNPFYAPDDGWYADPLQEDDTWTLTSGEIADLCEGEAAVTLDGLHFAVPRVYSNVALDGHKVPCQPSSPDEVFTDVYAEPSQIQAVPRGSDVTFELTGWSNRPVDDWNLRTRRATASRLTEAEMEPLLSSPVINNNRKVTLTLHAPETANVGDTGAVYVLSGPNDHPWAVGFVVTEAR